MDEFPQMDLPFPAVGDDEGDFVPPDMPGIVDTHVQCFDMNSPDMDLIYEVCSQRGKPLVMHVGREPKSEAYMCDPYELCRAENWSRC